MICSISGDCAIAPAARAVISRSFMRPPYTNTPRVGVGTQFFLVWTPIRAAPIRAAARERGRPPRSLVGQSASTVAALSEALPLQQVAEKVCQNAGWQAKAPAPPTRIT